MRLMRLLRSTIESESRETDEIGRVLIRWSWERRERRTRGIWIGLEAGQDAELGFGCQLPWRADGKECDRWKRI